MEADVGKWIEKYILADGIYYAKDEHGHPYYARTEAGNEIYPSRGDTVMRIEGLPGRDTQYAKDRFGDEYYPSHDDDLKINRFAKDRRGKLFYPKKRNGDEYSGGYQWIVKDGDFYSDTNDDWPLSKQAVVTYPLDRTGKPIYPVTFHGDPFYVYYNGKYHIATDRDGDAAYLQRPDEDDHMSEVYPRNRTYGFLKDGVTPKYALNFRGEVVFPVRNQREFYLTHGETGDDFTEGVHRYAWGGLAGGQIYPKKTNGVRYEALIDNRYALNHENRFYYPLDGHGNQYYISWTDPSLREVDVVLHPRYALSHTGHAIVPKKDDAPYLSKTATPSTRAENVTGEVDRGFGDRGDYLTDVRSDTTPGQLRRWKEKYIRTRDARKIFAEDERGEYRYAMNAVGNELYPVIDGEPVFLRYGDGSGRYPKDSDGIEMYYRYPKHTGKVAPLLDDRYALWKERHEYYPILDGKEIAANGRYAKERGVEFYPRNKDGDEYSVDEVYITRQGKVVYPLSRHGRPIYPTVIRSKRKCETYVRAYDRYHIGRNVSGQSVYAQEEDEEGHMNDIYPPDKTCAFSSDEVTPKYAKNFRGEAIFPQDGQGRELYWIHKTTLDDSTDGLDRYARRFGHSVYPQKFRNANRKTYMYEALIRNRYATTDSGFGYYPLDCFGNEYYISWIYENRKLTEEDVLLKNTYALSETGYYIVPMTGNKPYLSATAQPSVQEENIKGKIERGFDAGVADYLTDLKSHAAPRKIWEEIVKETDPDSGKHPEKSDKNLPKDSRKNQGKSREKEGKKGTPIYQVWYFWILLTTAISLVLFFVWTETISVNGLLDWMVFRRLSPPQKVQ